MLLHDIADYTINYRWKLIRSFQEYSNINIYSVNLNVLPFFEESSKAAVEGIEEMSSRGIINGKVKGIIDDYEDYYDGWGIVGRSG